MSERDELVNQFWEFVRQGFSYAEAWQHLREWSEQRGRQRGLADPTQSWRALSGPAFEIIAQQMVTEEVTKSPLASDIVLFRWDEAPEWMRNGILSERVWPKGEVREPAIASSNVDLIASAMDRQGNPEKVVCVYSCKSSVAERYQQDLYWAEKLRARSIKFCFVTIDRGFLNYATGAEEPVRDTKAITLSRALYDRIYLLTRAPIVRWTQVFKRIEEVVQDMELWLRAD